MSLDQNYGQVWDGAHQLLLQSIRWKDRVVVILLAMLSVDKKQIDRLDPIFMSLWEVQLIVGVVIGLMLEKGATTNGLILRVHLVRFA